MTGWKKKVREWADAPTMNSTNVSDYEREQINQKKPWRTTHRVHEWRNYIPEEMESMWADLPFEARVLVFMVCEEAAQRDEWD